MQAISIAIGKTGIDFFAKQFLSQKILGLLAQLSAPTRDIPIKNFTYTSAPLATTTVSNLVVIICQGTIEGYSPSYQQGVAQGTSNGAAIFTLTFPSGSFSADYLWKESYDWVEQGVTPPPHPVGFTRKGHENYSHDYDPGFSGLLVTVVVQFGYDAQNGWQITVQSTQGKATPSTDMIPSGSVLNNQTENCSGFHIDDTTAQAIADVDFSTPVNGLISGVLKTIPGSGNLGDGIVYNFSIGDGGVAFPNGDGIQMGVKGGASYNGAVFSENTIPSLPFPPPPADSDTHHLNMYVSNYEMDALYWAYYKAGKLNMVIKPQDLPNPAALTVASYLGWEPALAPYANNDDVMYADIDLNAAPTTAFQITYIYDKSVMQLLQSQLPADVYDSVEYLASQPFLSLQALESFLNDKSVPAQYFDTIEKAGKTSSMVVNHDLSFNLVIQDKQYNYPYIKFRVTRTDILTNLQLGLSSNQAQTLQFGFIAAGNTATFVDSSVPNFNGQMDFGGPLWTVSGESFYASNLQALGKTGVPLPIMSGFQFDFDNAELSVQEGYVSILASVSYQDSANSPGLA